MAEDNETCFVCGTPGADSRDHVIPLCLFAHPRPNALLTLPAHHSCHNELQEEYFRSIAVWQGSESSNTANILWESKVARSLQRNRPLRDSLRTSLLKQVDLFSPGGIWLGTAPGIRFNRDQFYPTLEKILRGLYRHHMERYLPINSTFNWVIINEPLEGEILEIFQFLKPGLSYPDIFECRFGIVSDGITEMSVWWLRFYQELVMRCVTRIDLTGTL